MQTINFVNSKIIKSMNTSKASLLIFFSFWFAYSACADNVLSTTLLARESNEPFKIELRNSDTYDGSEIYIVVDREENFIGKTDLPVNQDTPVPPALQALFERMMKKKSSISTESIEDEDWMIPPTFGDAVPALIQTKWGQLWPYNEFIPEQGGTHYPTGCCATALAQVMNYYGFPKTFSGLSGPVPQNPCDWESLTPTTFDFPLMLDTYPRAQDGTVAQDNVDAVAKLMYYSAQAIATSYSHNGSGSISSRVVSALGDIFGYEKPTLLWQRSFKGEIHDWAELLHDQINDGHPVIFFGNSVGNGHSFICDGYQDGWNFHFNLGWDGNYDGFYDIRNIAGDTFDYSEDIEIIYDIRPKANSAIANVAEESCRRPEGQTWELYSISGVKLAAGNGFPNYNDVLSPGVYLLKTTSGCSKFLVR